MFRPSTSKTVQKRGTSVFLRCSHFPITPRSKESTGIQVAWTEGVLLPGAPFWGEASDPLVCQVVRAGTVFLADTGRARSPGDASVPCHALRKGRPPRATRKR